MRNGMRIGRAEDLDVWVNHRSISREHAEIRVDGEDVSIVDLGSANGMRVNGEDTKETVLGSGDVIELGQVRFRFVAEGEHYVFEADRTVQMDAVTISEPPPSKTSYIAAAVILLIAVIVGAGIALSSGDEPNSVPVVDDDPNGETNPTEMGEEAEGTPAAAALEMVQECEQARQQEDYDEAVRFANNALELDPGNRDAQTCKDDAQRVISENETFERGLAAIDEGDVEGAYFAFEELPEDSPFRDREEVANVREAFAQFHLEQARELLGAEPEEAQSHANAVLTTEGISRSQERAARQILARLNAPPPTGRNTMRRGMRGTRMTGGGGTSGQQTATNDTAEMEAAMTGGGPVNVREVQRECHYDNRCIITRLRGAPQNAQVLGVLVEANRSIGNGPATRRLMQQYLRRYPTGPQAGAYRRQLGQ